MIINLTLSPWKKTWGAYARGHPSPVRNLDPPSLWISVALRGKVGVWIFSWTTQCQRYDSLHIWRDIQKGEGTFLGSGASAPAVKLWGIFEYSLARQSALVTRLFTQLCRLKIWTNLTLKTKLCACRCWVMDNCEI